MLCLGCSGRGLPARGQRKLFNIYNEAGSSVYAAITRAGDRAVFARFDRCRPPDGVSVRFWCKELEPRNLINNFGKIRNQEAEGRPARGLHENAHLTVEHDFTFLCRCTVFLVYLLVQFYKLNQLGPIDLCFQINNVCSVYLLFIR